MRKLAAVLCLGAVAAAGELTIGDKAPKIDIAHWVTGEPVTELAPDHVYVVEFWATW